MTQQQNNLLSIVRLAMPAIQRGIQKALMRHRLLGESIVIMCDGEIVTLTGDEIPVPELDNPDSFLNDN